MLLVEQNAAQALKRAHRAYVLETGRDRQVRRCGQPARRPRREGRLPGRMNVGAHAALAVGRGRRRAGRVGVLDTARPVQAARASKPGAGPRRSPARRHVVGLRLGAQRRSARATVVAGRLAGSADAGGARTGQLLRPARPSCTRSVSATSGWWPSAPRPAASMPCRAAPHGCSTATCSSSSPPTWSCTAGRGRWPSPRRVPAASSCSSVRGVDRRTDLTGGCAWSSPDGTDFVLHDDGARPARRGRRAIPRLGDHGTCLRRVRRSRRGLRHRRHRRHHARQGVVVDRSGELGAGRRASRCRGRADLDDGRRSRTARAARRRVAQPATGSPRCACGRPPPVRHGRCSRSTR